MSGSLPNWLADWLGVERAGSSGGEAATWRIDLVWPWPPWATVLLVLVGVIGIGLIYRHEISSAGRRYRVLLAALRLAAFALVLLMLTQATLTLERTGPPGIALVVDRSASMGISDEQYVASQSSQLRTRLDQAKSLLEANESELLQKLTDNYRMQVYSAAAGVEKLDSEDVAAKLRELSFDGPGSEASRLGDAVRTVLDDYRGTPPAAIVMLTDGVVTDGTPLADSAQDARSRGVPLFAVGLGSDRPPRDVQVTDVLVDDVVFVDDLVGFAVQIKATGLAGESARVVLRRGDDGELTPLAEQTVTLGPDGEPQTIFLTHRPTAAGEIPYIVEVVARDDETNQDNNRERRMITVRDEKIRVLLAFGYPNYEFRFLKTMLERDRTIELSAYLQDADPDYAEQDRAALRAFPFSRNELFDYDVLVLGDVDPRRLPRSIWPQIEAFVVEKGGGMVFIAGPRYLPWTYGEVPEVAPLLPFDLDTMRSSSNPLPEDVTRGFVMRPTPLGLRLAPLQLGDNPVETEQIWRDLPPLYWLAEIDDWKPAAQVLAEHPTHTTGEGRRLPVIVGQYVGAGTVWFHATDSTWRWRIGMGDVYFARYWVQTIRYLARGKLTSGRGAELATDRREYLRGEAVQVRLRFLDERLAPADDEVTAFMETAGEARQRTTLRRNPTARGVFEGSLANLGEGQYELLVSGPEVAGKVATARFSVVAPAGEMARVAMDRAALTYAAETSRGKFYTLTDADRLADELPRGRRVPIESLTPLEIWNRWWLLAPFLAVIIAEWILRKRKGML